MELCAVCGTVLADEDGIYDPNDSNDRLLLGLKGTISEFELVTMRNRLERGKLNKAQRGELFHKVPLGYLKLATGEVILEPDEQARAVVQLLFDKFDELGTLYGMFRYLVRNKIRLGMRIQDGPQRGELEWRQPALPTLNQVLHNPIYAGAYAYGRQPSVARRKAEQKPGRRFLPMSEWKVLLHDRLPAYISWDPVSGQSAAASGEPLAARFIGDAAEWLCAADGPVGLWKLRTLLAIFLSEQNSRVLTVASAIFAKMQTGCAMDCKRHRSMNWLPTRCCAPLNRRRWNSASRRWKTFNGNATVSIGTGSNGWNGHVTNRNGSSVSTKPSSRKIASWRARWNSAGKKRSASNGNSKRIMTDFSKSNRSSYAMTSVPGSKHCRSTCRPCGMLPRPLRKTVREIIRLLVERVIVHVRPDSEYVEATHSLAGRSYDVPRDRPPRAAVRAATGLRPVHGAD